MNSNWYITGELLRNGTMKKPITITITDEQEKKARSLQAKLISATNENWSFSQVVGILLDEGLKNTTIEKAKKLKKLGLF